MSFAKRVAQERGFSLYLINSEIGLKFYAYILIPSTKNEMFETAVKSGAYNINDFGSVIEFFIGESEAPKDLKLDIQKFIESQSSNK